MSRCPFDTDGDGNCPRHPGGCPSTWEQFARWLSADWSGSGPLHLSIALDPAGEWSFAAQFGREAADSPMAAGALYGMADTVTDAIQQGLNDLSPYSRGLA